ncbi:hypothetical protein FRB97_002425, partial [Tulasnella sp. 331]
METSTETKPKTPPPQIVLALVVPALSAAKQMVQEINDLVEHVSVRKSECKALAVQATATIKAMEDMYPTTNDAQLKQSVSLLEKALSDILKEMRPWKNSYFRIRFKYWEIPNRVKFHQSDLDEALNVAKNISPGYQSLELDAVFTAEVVGAMCGAASSMTEATVAVKILQPVKAEYTSEEEHLIGERLQK